MAEKVTRDKNMELNPVDKLHNRPILKRIFPSDDKLRDIFEFSSELEFVKLVKGKSNHHCVFTLLH